jgi:hypothetical protein
MRKLLIIVFLFTVFASCSGLGERHISHATFTKRLITLPTDTTVRSVAYLDGCLLLLQDDGKLVALDTAYRRIENVEKKLARVKGTFLVAYNDTLFVGSKNKTFYLKSDFTLVEYKVKRRMYGNVLLQDSAYLIYGCCVGEFGGSVFFLNKQTGKTYSYFATCPSQVLRFGKEYVVSNNLAHLSDHMSFLVVKDPTTLYEITDEKLKNYCNWYTTVDSLKDYWQVSKKGNVRFYDAYDAMSLVTFPFADSLYSVLSVPKATVLAVHRGDTTITTDTLFDRKIAFHETQVIEAGKRKVCLFRLTEGSPVAAYWTRGNNTGLIVVEENRIDFLERLTSK